MREKEKNQSFVEGGRGEEAHNFQCLRAGEKTEEVPRIFGSAQKVISSVPARDKPTHPAGTQEKNVARIPSGKSENLFLLLSRREKKRVQ